MQIIIILLSSMYLTVVTSTSFSLPQTLSLTPIAVEIKRNSGTESLIFLNLSLEMYFDVKIT